MITHVLWFVGGAGSTVIVRLISAAIFGFVPRERIDKKWMEREIMPVAMFDVMFTGMEAAKKSNDYQLMLSCLWHALGTSYRLHYDQIRQCLKLSDYWQTTAEISNRCRIDLATKERIVELEQSGLDAAI